MSDYLAAKQKDSRLSMQVVETKHKVFTDQLQTTGMGWSKFEKISIEL